MRWTWVLFLGAAGCVDPFPTITAADPVQAGDMQVSDAIVTDRGGADMLRDAIAIPDAAPDADPDVPRAPAPGELIINEIDYDQPMTDMAEFIELLNVGSAPLDLRTVKIDLINGADGLVYRNAFIDHPRLDPSHRVVLYNSANPPPVPADVSTVPIFEGVQIQNGPNDNDRGDGIRLLVGEVVIDSVAYAGQAAGAGEGAPAPVDPSDGDFSISRCEDGADSDDNASDFKQAHVTPGARNNCEPIDGDIP